MSYTNNHSCISFFAGPTEANKRKRQLLGEPRDTNESKRAAWQSSQGNVARTRNISTLANFDIAGFASDVIQQKWFMDSKRNLQLKGYINSPYVSTDQLATHASNEGTNIMAGNAGTIRNLISRAGPTLPFPHVSEIAGAYGDANAGLYPYNMYLEPNDPLSVNFARSLYDDQSRLSLIVQQGVMKQQLIDDKNAGLIGQQARELPKEQVIMEEMIGKRTRDEMNHLQKTNQNSSEQQVNLQLGNAGTAYANYKMNNGGETLSFENLPGKKPSGEVTNNSFSQFKQQSGSNHFNRNKLEPFTPSAAPITGRIIGSVNTGHVQYTDSTSKNATEGTVGFYSPKTESILNRSKATINSVRQLSYGDPPKTKKPKDSAVVKELDDLHRDFNNFTNKGISKNDPIVANSKASGDPNVTRRNGRSKSFGRDD